ncbi:MAG: FAD:protein FMN transferase [Bacillota bacterium]
MRKKIGLGLVIITLLVGLTVIRFNQQDKVEEYQTQQFLMDTVVTLKIKGDNAEKVGTQVVQRMREIADQATRYHQESIVTKINQQAGIKPVAVNQDIFKMITTAKKYGRLTDGAFDVTIAPVVELWGFGTEENQVPAQTKIEDRLELVDYQQIKIDQQQQTVMLAEQGMKLDLGGIAKGYIVDQAAKMLQEAGIKSALINAGGNIRTIGTKPNGSKWRIGIQHPRSQEESDSNYIDIVEVAATNLVTSGDYERYFSEEGKRYHHILDPQTGYPARGLVSVTVISDSSFQADILSTALFILGFKRAKQYIKQHDNLEGMLVTPQLDIWRSPGFKELTVN